MPTTNYTETDAEFGFFGFFDLLTTPGQRFWLSIWGTWTGYITGTDATMTSAGGDVAPYWISVDGGAETHQTLVGGVTPLFSGLSDTPHLVRIRSDSAYDPTFAWTFTTGNFLNVTGAAPAIGQGTDLGPSYILTDPSFPGMHSLYLAAAPGGNIRPVFNLTTNSAPNLYALAGAILVKAQCADLWLFTGSNEIWIATDGGALTEYTIGTTSPVASWRKIASGLDNTAYHDYLIVPASSGSNITEQSLGVMIGGASATYSAVTSRPRLIQFGDSITQGDNRADTSTASTDVYKYCHSAGFMPHAAGYGGQTASQLALDIPGIVAAQAALPDYAILAIGRNNTSGSGFQTDYLACINAILTAGIPKILCRRIIPDNLLDFKLTLDADIQTVVTTLANPTVGYMGDDTWIGITTIEGDGGVDGANPTAGGTHPDKTGYVTLAGLELSSITAFFTAFYAQSVGGNLSFTGGLLKSAQKTVTGLLSFSGAMSMLRTKSVTLSGSLSFSGSLGKAVAKTLSGSLGLAGGLQKACAKSVGGVLSFAGGLVSTVTGLISIIAKINFIFAKRRITFNKGLNMDIVNEKSSSYVTVDFTDQTGAAAIPAAITYSTKCKTTGIAIKTNIAVTPASSITIKLDALDNAIQTTTNQSEDKLLTVHATYGASDECNDEYVWRVKNLDGV